MGKRIGGLLLLALILGAFTGCGTRVSEPWLGSSQRNLYGPDQIQRDAATADTLRHRLQYRMARR